MRMTASPARGVGFGTLGGVSRGNQDVYGFGGRLRAAYLQPFGQSYLKPYVDLDLIYTDASGYVESGAGLLDRRIAGSSQWAALASPTLELGTRFDLDDTYTLDGYARVGLAVSSVDQWSSDAWLAAAPAGAAGFTTMLPVDNFYGRIGAGLNLASSSNTVSLRAEYEATFSSDTTRQTGSLRLSIGF